MVKSFVGRISRSAMDLRMPRKKKPGTAGGPGLSGGVSGTFKLRLPRRAAAPRPRRGDTALYSPTYSPTCSSTSSSTRLPAVPDAAAASAPLLNACAATTAPPNIEAPAVTTRSKSAPRTPLRGNNPLPNTAAPADSPRAKTAPLTHQRGKGEGLLPTPTSGGAWGRQSPRPSRGPTPNTTSPAQRAAVPRKSDGRSPDAMDIDFVVPKSTVLDHGPHR
ncbi:hypothetical protein T484DRAFT_2788943 [Baffinella frigidus]|nr:hypothetical protein T484DRAFT_2788943 [Cryptophyta sp. CCMP2293]